MCPLHFSENMKLKEMNAVLYLMQQTNRNTCNFGLKKNKKHLC